MYIVHAPVYTSQVQYTLHHGRCIAPCETSTASWLTCNWSDQTGDWLHKILPIASTRGFWEWCSWFHPNHSPGSILDKIGIVKIKRYGQVRFLFTAVLSRSIFAKRGIVKIPTHNVTHFVHRPRYNKHNTFSITKQTLMNKLRKRRQVKWIGRWHASIRTIPLANHSPEG